MNVPEVEIDGREAECGYLPGRRALMTYRLAFQLEEARYEQLLARGWRRFGRSLFRPVCRGCSECRSLRVVLPDVRLTKSQRRSLKRNSDIRVHVGRPAVSDERVALYNAYHADMHERRDWPEQEITPREYFESFLDGGFTFAREFQYRLNGQLIGLGLVDVTSRVLSSVYFFYSPEYRDRGLGTFSVLQEINYGTETGRSHLYMGYYIRECASMSYKSRFGRHEILADYCADDDEPVWQTPGRNITSESS